MARKTRARVGCWASRRLAQREDEAAGREGLGSAVRVHLIDWSMFIRHHAAHMEHSRLVCIENDLQIRSASANHTCWTFSRSRPREIGLGSWLELLHDNVGKSVTTGRQARDRGSI